MPTLANVCQGSPAAWRRTLDVVTTSRADAATERGRVAGERAELAGQRRAELHQRGVELAAGQQQTVLAVLVARAALGDSAQRAEKAAQYAWIAYLRAARAHRNAADVAESRGDSGRAEEHRELAAADDARAAALD
jgi:hypothetical protein